MYDLEIDQYTDRIRYEIRDLKFKARNFPEDVDVQQHKDNISYQVDQIVALIRTGLDLNEENGDV